MNQCRLAMSIQYRENNIDTATFPYWFGFKNNKKFYWHVYLQTHSPTHTDLRIDTHIDTHTQTHIQTHIHTQTRTHTHNIIQLWRIYTEKNSWGILGTRTTDSATTSEAYTGWPTGLWLRCSRFKESSKFFCFWLLTFTQYHSSIVVLIFSLLLHGRVYKTSSNGYRI